MLLVVCVLLRACAPRPFLLGFTGRREWPFAIRANENNNKSNAFSIGKQYFRLRFVVVVALNSKHILPARTSCQSGELSAQSH